MKKSTADGIIKDWGDRLFYPRVRGRKGKNILGGRRPGPSSAAPSGKPTGPATRERLVRTLNKTPEVMVKITGGGKNVRQIETHLRYISREGEVEIEDENGDRHQGIDEVLDVRDGWAKSRIGIPTDGAKRKEAFNIMLSMPPGTDRQAVTAAAREFAKELFGNHQYVFAAHCDEAHPHVHLAVKAVDRDAVRLNPRKGDLQHWRETFAAKLHEQGIAANATPRRARGVVRKAEKQAVVHINKDYEAGRRKERARTTQRQLDDAVNEVNTGTRRENPAATRIAANRKATVQAYGAIAGALAGGGKDDKQLALRVVHFVKAMPSAATRHDALVQRLRAGRDCGAELSREQPREPERGGEPGRTK